MHHDQHLGKPAAARPPAGWLTVAIATKMAGIAPDGQSALAAGGIAVERNEPHPIVNATPTPRAQRVPSPP